MPSFELGAQGRVPESPVASAHSAADSLLPVPSVLLPIFAFWVIVSSVRLFGANEISKVQVPLSINNAMFHHINK